MKNLIKGSWVYSKVILFNNQQLRANKEYNQIEYCGILLNTIEY